MIFILTQVKRENVSRINRWLLRNYVCSWQGCGVEGTKWFYELLQAQFSPGKLLLCVDYNIGIVTFKNTLSIIAFYGALKN